jgi:hypothetical protein
VSNMSYCRFQNTLGDLEDCQDALNDVGCGGPEALSANEQRAAKRMLAVCREMVADWGDFFDDE